MKWYRQLWELTKHVKGSYLILLLIYPLLVLPEAMSGLVAKGVFDILQGLEIISIFSGKLTIEVGREQSGRIEWVFYLVGGLVALHLVRVLPYFADLYWSVRLRHLITSLLQKNMLTSIYRRPGAEGLPNSAGEAVSRFRGDANEAAYFVFSTRFTISNLIIGSVALALLMHVDAWITSVVFFPLLVVVISAVVAAARVERYRQASRETTGDVSGAIGEIFGAVQAVQVACAENRVIKHLRELNERRRSAGLKDVLFNNLLGVIFGGVTTICFGVVVMLAGSKLRSGDLTAGDFALYHYYLIWILGVPITIGGMLVRIPQVKVSINRMLELVGQDAPDQLVARSPTYLWGEYPSLTYIEKQPCHHLQQLDVVGLTAKFSDSDQGIEDISFSLNRGSFTVITGRVGSGKSTLLRAVLGLLPMDRGEVYWNGELVVSPDNFFVPPRSAYVAQVPRLYSDSLRDNILMGMPEERANLPEALRRSALDEIEELLEDGLDTLVGPRGTRLSGGQLQRAAAARMFVKDAELLVFDDLSSALDVKTEQKLWQRITEADSTCLVVSHRRAVLSAADQIIVLNEGHVEGIGTLQELLEHSEEMRRIWAED